MTDLDELIFVDENDFTTLAETFWADDFQNTAGEEDFTEEAENLRYLEMLQQLDEFELACKAAADADEPETD